MHTLWFMKISIFFNLFTAATLFANDGFYQGGGNTLAPVSNQNLEVITETLDITALSKAQCYDLTFAGKSMRKTKTVSKGGEGVLSGKVSCAMTKERGFHRDILKTQWHAKAVYRVRALKNQKDVQMGFPVPRWSDDRESPGNGLEWVHFPGVVGFKTFVNGKPIEGLRTASVEVPNSEGETEKKTAPAFVWNLSFDEGKEYELKTEYDFGSFYSAAFFVGREIPEGSMPWFDTRSGPEARYGYTTIPSEGILYYLSPLKLWGTKPPEKVSVRVETLPGMPVYYMLPNTKGLKAVDSKALYWEWENAFPEGELKVNYPRSETGRPFVAKAMTQNYEFLAWLSLVNSLVDGHPKGNWLGPLKLGCDLVTDLKTRLGKDSNLAGWVENGSVTCVKAPLRTASNR